ncbi:MAG: tRNA (guanosine(37)-N1)-methyltransferase TrmD [Lachnospiraceae bacterium]|nr:tRNA (guanosine(37)-N1)-methyltransferase TrmD [Lachnospiraceae bacterium]
MNFHVLTLFPELIEGVMHTGIMGRALSEDRFRLACTNIRDYADNPRAQIDDYTYGGGAGMLLRAQPVFDAYSSVPAVKAEKHPRCVYMTPQGESFTERKAKEFAMEEDLILLCGHYEGIDERVLSEIVTDRISVGDYVLSGGELPALIVMDAVARLLPGVLGNETSADVESFYRDLLEYPQYSRPEVWHDMEVPPVLLTGDHKQIEGWRLERSKELTGRVRPDLYRKYLEREELLGLLSREKRTNIAMLEALRYHDTDVRYRDDRYVILKDYDDRTVYIGRIDRSLEPLAEEGYKALEGETSRIVAREGALSPEAAEAYLPGKKGCQVRCSLYTETHPVPTKKVDREDGYSTEAAAWTNELVRDGKVPYRFYPAEDTGTRAKLEALGYYTSEALLEVFEGMAGVSL